MLTFDLTNGTRLEITLNLSSLTLTQVWKGGEKQVVTVPLPDVKRIAEQVRGLVRFFV